ncbi:tetratricopeptide repeat protein [Actinoplanes solisilvae]|uniref:tetratricopeptide repeat protein n=1 Tax=Actinoplanes solisilvae TaxID=2486853 RepID=UPI000FD93EE5|nr:tetratricopeptide repeat protein [Actinoplanes solisilvae]
MPVGDDEKAGRWQALELFGGLGKQAERGLVYRNLGQVSFAQGDYHDSIAYCERALRLSESLADRPGQVPVLCRLADAYARLGKHGGELQFSSVPK